MKWASCLIGHRNGPPESFPWKLPQFGPTPSNPKLQRPSTNAAAEKKVPGTASADEKANGADKKLTVPVREFEVMAERIAKSQDASLKIPRGFINLIKRCIKTRRGVGLVSGKCPRHCC
jgi:hypothetical protein